MFPLKDLNQYSFTIVSMENDDSIILRGIGHGFIFGTVFGTVRFFKNLARTPDGGG